MGEEKNRLGRRTIALRSVHIGRKEQRTRDERGNSEDNTGELWVFQEIDGKRTIDQYIQQ